MSCRPRGAQRHPRHIYDLSRRRDWPIESGVALLCDYRPPRFLAPHLVTFTIHYSPSTIHYDAGMDETITSPRIERRSIPIDMYCEQFRALGHALIDALADFREGLPERPVSPGKSPDEVRAVIEQLAFPEEGHDPATLLAEILPLLADNQAFNGHPRWLAYITSSPAPMGVLADLIVAALNPNLGLWQASPIATEIELQTAAWIADLIGFPGKSGVMTSGGQWANHLGFLVARRAKAPWDVRAGGAAIDATRRLRVYASAESHGWLKQAADIFGSGHGFDPLDPARSGFGHGPLRPTRGDPRRSRPREISR